MAREVEQRTCPSRLSQYYLGYGEWLGGGRAGPGRAGQGGAGWGGLTCSIIMLVDSEKRCLHMGHACLSEKRHALHTKCPFRH